MNDRGSGVAESSVQVLVTGAGGQVGAELGRAAWPGGVMVTALDRDGLDITDAGAVAATVGRLAPDIIVNAAAYTAVDRAESEPELARAVNSAGVAHLATAASEVDARLIHISTDYVFDGTKDGWYVEADARRPLGVYGETKAAGEDAAAATPRHLILRTAWVYGALGPNFVATMRRVAAERDELRVVDDQIGCPTAAPDIAAAIVELATSDRGRDLVGTFHLASPSATTWYRFARAILAGRIESGEVTVTPITTDEYPTPAARPSNSRLCSDALADVTGIRLPDWADALPRVLAELDRTHADPKQES